MSNYRYQVGGSLAVDAVSYVARSADRELYDRLMEGDYCYIFNSRQMGKSSLLVQTFYRLRQKDYLCAIIDLTNIGSEQITPLQWYKGLVAQIYTELGLKDILKFRNWWNEQEDFSYLQRLSRFIEELLTVHFPHEKIFVFIDEIDTVLSLDFTVDDLFAFIRYCHERRTINPDYQRINFALSGVAAPSDLIRDRQRTPFNIGRAIALNNFQIYEVKPLLAGLKHSGDSYKLMQAILYWTGGQPFLTQKLCSLIASSDRNGSIVLENIERLYVENIVKIRIIKNWESQDVPEHFRTIRDRLFSQKKLTGRLLGIYQQILAGQRVKANESREHIELFLSGLIIKEQGCLKVKNPIYAAIFNSRWVETQLQNLRPYSQQFEAWIESKQTDKSRLLKGKALQDALLWSQRKSLSDLDYQYLAASQESDRESAQKTFEASRLKEVRSRLAETEKRHKQEQKANTLQRWLLAVAGVGLVITSVLGITAYRQYRKATVGEVKALVASAEGLFNSDRRLDGLVAAVKASKKLGQNNINNNELKDLVKQALKKNVYGGIESNRFSEFEGGVHAIAFSPDGQTIATGTLSNKIKLWQKNGTLSKTLTEHEDSIWALAYSFDGSILASGSADGKVKLWQPDGTLDRTLQGHQWGVWHVVFSPNGKLIASSGLDGKINLWQQDGTLLKTITEDSAMLGLAFSPDGRVLASGGNDTVIKLRDLEGKVLKTLESEGAIQRLAFSPDGQILAAALNNGIIELWQLDGKLLLTLSGYEGGVRGVEFSPDGKTIASASIDNAVRLWQPEGNKSVRIIRQASAVSGLAVSDDGRLIASGNDDGMVKLWDNRGNLLQNMPKHDREITSIAFSPHSKTIASGGRDKTVKLWDIDGNLLNSITDHEDKVDTVDYFLLANGKLQSNSAAFVSAGWDGNLKFRDRLGNTLRTIQVCNQISTFNFSPDGELMFVGCIEDSTIKILDNSGELIKTLKGHQSNVLDIVVDRDRSKIISSSINGTIKIWNLDGTLDKNLSEHPSAVWSIDLSPDNRLIASSSSDRTIKIWKTDGTLLKTLNGHTQTVNQVIFSPDGKYLISSSDDKTIRIWNLAVVLDSESIYQQGCNLLRDYLRTNVEVEQSDRALCDDVEE